MSLGNEASTEPRLNLRLANSLGATDNGGRWRAEAATAAVADPAQWTLRWGIIVQAELPKGSMNLCGVALVKQDRGKRLVPHLRLGRPL